MAKRKRIPSENPLTSLRDALDDLHHTQIVLNHRGGAWLYGIINGYNEHGHVPEAFDHLKEQHGFTDANIERMKRLRERYKALEKQIDDQLQADNPPKV